MGIVIGPKRFFVPHDMCVSSRPLRRYLVELARHTPQEYVETRYPTGQFMYPVCSTYRKRQGIMMDPETAAMRKIGGNDLLRCARSHYDDKCNKSCERKRDYVRSPHGSCKDSE